MKKTRIPLSKRLTSLFLTLVIMFGLLLPSAPHAHAAAAVTLTNKDGTVTDTFTIGDPVFMEISGIPSTNWVDLWYVKPDGTYESTYRLWWYTPDGKVNLWDGVWTETAGFYDGMNLPSGTYELYFESTDLLASFTLVEPEAAATAEKSLAVEASGTTVSITAVNYAEYSHVSVVNEDGVELQKFFCPGRNGLTMEYELIPGEYTISMYNDWYKTELQEQQKITIEGEKVELLTTDKTEYKFGEPILITSMIGNPNWVGLYKQDDANPTSAGPTSLFWLYPTVGEAVNLLTGEQQRHSEFVAGTYKVLLLDANYGILASVENIVITTEIDESKTVTVPATCEQDGSATYYNTDSTVAKVETLPALGHDYETLRPVFDAEDLQHTYVCSNDNRHTKTENCFWDDGVVTKEPTDEEDGIKEFTCTVCGGTRTEKYAGKEILREEITTPATCEQPGIKTVYYTDGTSEEVDIPKLNHAYPDTYAYNNDKATHSRICGNDPTHVETADCSFASGTVAGGTRYTCSVCQGYYDVIILSTSKTEYALGEPILVTVDSSVYDETSTDWVGIWENGKTYTDSVSIYYYYPSAQGWTDFNLYQSAYHQRDSIGIGEYTIRLFAADGYSEITSMNITVGPAVRDESATVRVEPTCEKDGSITYYLTNGEIDEVITAEQDASLKAFGHAYPEIWTPVAGTETHSRVCGNDPTHVETADCSWNEGVETLAPTVSTKGEMLYTCTVCGSTRTEEIPELAATEVSREVIAPTCEEKGYTLVTYDNGDTLKFDYVNALGHDFGDEYIHVEGTHTHSRQCRRPDCAEVEIADCQLETNGVLSGNYYSYACTKCGEWEEKVILTDKDVYASGEDIIITLHPNYAATMGSKDWIGLYKKGETPSSGGVTSIRWNYVGSFVDGMSIFNSSNHDRPEEDPNNFLKAGEYTLFLCANDGYSILARTAITVTTEEDPAKTVTVQPTCTEDGTRTYYNTDGTLSRVVTAAEDATLKAHGHTYSSWTFSGIEKQTHTRTCVCPTCGEKCTFTESSSCEWDEGVVTKEPSVAETGIKTYTCSVCQGAKEEVLPKTNATVTGTETVDATCETPGYIRTHYSDGTYFDEVIPATGHAYGSWTYDAATKHHKQVCANDASHIISEACTMDKVVSGSSVNYTCSVCEGGYVTGLLETDKTVYGITDPIMVTVHATYPSAWVGLYREGEQYDPNSGGVASLFWAYITSDMVGKPFDLLTEYTDQRGERLGNGKYILVFFGDDGYTDVVSKVELEIFTDMSNAEFELRFHEGLPRENGYHTSFLLSNVDNPADGEKVTLGAKVLSGEVGSSWIGVFEGGYDLNTDYDDMVPILFKYISDINGDTNFSLNWAAKGGFDFYVGNFTIVIFADASASYPVKYVTFEVYRTVVAGSEVSLKAPTCETPGLKMVNYEDDGDPNTQDTNVLVELPPLGHDYGDWKSIDGTNTHSGVCTRENCGKEIVETCVFENDVCTVCAGTKYRLHDVTKVPAKTTDCDIPGNLEYYVCECGKWFKDADATQEITDKNSVIIPAPGHKYGSWVYNESAKAHSRTCANNANHTETVACTFGPAELIQQPTSSSNGIRKYTCTVCGGSYTEEFSALSGTYERIYGETRCETSIEVAEQLKENLGLTKFETVLVASGDDFVDALSGTYLASKLNAPILLVRKNDMAAVKEYIRNNLVAGGTVYILGGPLAIPYTMESGLDGFNVKRLGGETRYDTNLLILKEAGVVSGQDILVCTSKGFADSLSASAVCKPILLVDTTLYDTQKEFLNSVSGGNLYIIGGKVAVSEKLANELAAYGSVNRIDGANRYETSVNVAKTFFDQTACAVLVYGNNFPDGLCGGALAQSMGAPLLLATNNDYAVAAKYAADSGVTCGIILGGPGLVKDSVVEKIFLNQ